MARNITCKKKQPRMSPPGRILHFRGNFILCHKIALGRHRSYIKLSAVHSRHTLCDAYHGVTTVSTVWLLMEFVQKFQFNFNIKGHSIHHISIAAATSDFSFLKWEFEWWDVTQSLVTRFPLVEVVECRQNNKK